MVLANPSLRSGQAALAEEVDVLTRTLHEEPDSMVRERAARALRRLDPSHAAR